jgi:DHA2 family multidrug resistance protein
MAYLSTTLTTQTANHMTALSSRVSIASTEAQAMIAGLTQLMAERGVSDPGGAARKAFSYILNQQASILAFGDGFTVLAIAGALAAALALLAKPVKTPPSAAALEAAAEAH